MAAAKRYRYRVIGTWGDVPDDVRRIVGSTESFLLYDDYFGLRKSETIEDHGDLVGGWSMVYAGRRED